MIDFDLEKNEFVLESDGDLDNYEVPPRDNESSDHEDENW